MAQLTIVFEIKLWICNYRSVYYTMFVNLTVQIQWEGPQAVAWSEDHVIISLLYKEHFDEYTLFNQLYVCICYPTAASWFIYTTQSLYITYTLEDIWVDRRISHHVIQCRPKHKWSWPFWNSTLTWYHKQYRTSEWNILSLNIQRSLRLHVNVVSCRVSE